MDTKLAGDRPARGRVAVSHRRGRGETKGASAVAVTAGERDKNKIVLLNEADGVASVMSHPILKDGATLLIHYLINFQLFNCSFSHVFWCHSTEKSTRYLVVFHP